MPVGQYLRYLQNLSNWYHNIDNHSLPTSPFQALDKFTSTDWARKKWARKHTSDRETIRNNAFCSLFPKLGLASFSLKIL